MKRERPGRRSMVRPAAVLLAAAMALPLAGCHGKKDTAAFAVPESFDESARHTLT